MKASGSRTSVDLFELVAHRVGELGAVDVERRPSLLRHDGEGERQRRVRDVGAADVEGPGHGVRIGDHQRVGAEVADLGADLVELRVRRFAGEAQIVQHHRPERRRRPVGPDRVDRIGLGRHERRAGVGAGAGQPLGAVGGVQPRVVAELGARRQVLLEPALRRGVGDRHDREHRGVDLGLAPAACSGRRRTARPCRRAPRSMPAEPVKPVSQASRSSEGGTYSFWCRSARGRIRPESPRLRQFGAQRLHARPGLRRLRVVERLETGLEHARQSMGRGRAGQLRAAEGTAGSAHINVHCNMMVALDIIARRDRSDQKSELIV